MLIFKQCKKYLFVGHMLFVYYILWIIYQHTYLVIPRKQDLKLNEQEFVSDYEAPSVFFSKRHQDLRIYTYNLSAKFSWDIVDQFDRKEGFDLLNHGYGGIIKHTDGLTIRNTHQASLDVIFYHRLQQSGFVTQYPDVADLFYIPYFHDFAERLSLSMTKQMLLELNKLQYYNQNKPHFMVIGRPMGLHHLDRLWTTKISFINVENVDGFPLSRKIKSPLILAPYPSFGHFNKYHGGKWIKRLYTQKRPVFIFTSIKNRIKSASRYQALRKQLYETLTKVTTNMSFANYSKQRKLTRSRFIKIVNYDINTAGWVLNLHEWMQNAVFCLHPIGDTFTRKAFYDSILCGCIPVIFQTELVDHATYPFESSFNYSSFSVTIPSADFLNYKSILGRYTWSDIAQLQANLLKVIQYLQYNDLDATYIGNDAFSMIIKELHVQYGI